ncbi:MAG: hypothetical protein V1776_01680 [Candidatus Diapherotrites archaeon]
MRMNRGQGTTEYLIILAIVIVIALVVVGVLGGFPGIGQNINEGQSKAYWGAAQPLALIDWRVAQSGSGSLVFQNQTANTITLNSVVWDGNTVSVGQSLGPGGKYTVTSTSIRCITAGQSYGSSLSYNYNTPNLSDIDFNGTTSVAGNCQ